jgi:hypothetical protein
MFVCRCYSSRIRPCMHVCVCMRVGACKQPLHICEGDGGGRKKSAWIQQLGCTELARGVLRAASSGGGVGAHVMLASGSRWPLYSPCTPLMIEDRDERGGSLRVAAARHMVVPALETALSCAPAGAKKVQGGGGGETEILGE